MIRHLRGMLLLGNASKKLLLGVVRVGTLNVCEEDTTLEKIGHFVGVE